MIFRALLLSVLLLHLQPALAQEKPDFSQWAPFLVQLKADALAEGINEAILDQVLADLEPDPRVIRFDRRQPEFVQTLEQYLTARLSSTRINSAKRNYQQYRGELEKVADVYGVPANVIVAFWGLESNFGRYQGKYSVVRSLATLAYDPRRSAFFRKELMHALRILDEGHIGADEFVGGWAGAMGQNQFMPSSFRNYAVDFDGDGRKNIWNSKLDVWASIAHYLTQNGWRPGEPWGYKVKLPADFDFNQVKLEKTPKGCRALRYLSRKQNLVDWQKLGFTPSVAGSDSGFEQYPLALLEPEEGSLETWLVADNYRAILDYNCANKYALSIGLLADML